jgi:hypothetical protein
MEAIGVFGTRESALNAMRELLARQVPRDSIVLLDGARGTTGSWLEQIGAYVGCFIGVGLGSSLAGWLGVGLLPDMGRVLALVFGLVVLFGAVGWGAGLVVCRLVTRNGNTSVIPAARARQDDFDGVTTLIREGRSVLLVRTESAQGVNDALEIMSRLFVEQAAAKAA